MSTLKKMKPTGLNRLRGLRRIMVRLRWLYLTRVWKYDLDPTAEFSLSAKFDRVFPAGVHIGAKTYVAFETYILTHDRTRGLYLHTRVGENCFIGGRSMILPGVEVGDNCVVGAGSVVTRSVPPRSLVAGNPAKILRSDIEVIEYGRFIEADTNEHALAVAYAEQ